MNENINLSENLKGCEGIEVYYAPLGINVKLVSAKTTYSDFPIQIDSPYLDNPILLSSTGAMVPKSEFPNAECVIFPSKTQRDWSKFEKPIAENTPMVVFNTWDEEDTDNYKIRYYARFENGKHNVYYYNSLRDSDSMIMSYDVMIPFDKFDPNNIKESLKFNIQK